MRDAKCTKCKSLDCYDGTDCFDLASEIIDSYSAEDRKSMNVSAKIESEYYMKLTRLEELIIYVKELGWKRVGIAFCIGLMDEARTLDLILSHEGFEVFSVCCKACGIDKKKLRLKKLHPEMEHEATCNPIGQAKILNRQNTELNIVIGLCMGHDILFTKYSEAPVSTFIVKDRVLSHNPAGALYSSYYRKNRFGLEE